VVLIGLFIVGPCGALLIGRRVLTVVAGLWASGLAVVLGLPDGIWGTTTHLAFLGAVGFVALLTTGAAALISNARAQVVTARCPPPIRRSSSAR
jgi:hypothetical protein